MATRENEYVWDSNDKPAVIFVLGGPGCGKGTQCKKIAEKFGYVHLSAGDLLRAERKLNGEYAKLINDCIKEGKLVPGDITVSLLKRAIFDSGKKRILVDGFPRSKENYDGWMRTMKDITFIPFIFFFDVPDDVMVERILGRAKTSGRIDDTVEGTKKRLKTYREESLPIIKMFQTQKLAVKVDATQDIDGVWNSTQEALNEFEAFAKTQA
eukprot:CAMPEP_0168531248 /NCGR_PEP_ID=MMETSP0405-20121227/15298_1 /TAXON_ID=498012 /ORGANISM="Trichosphaerium sp, Strain Am-I-7 wt" /LENGTH=210 /DNA_ID=CAMNT_0008555941 /DNA_START=9 /DNA_END=641 /DNA_ORIENTATION=+